MTPAALLLIFTAALAHSTWNLLAKRAQDPLAFLWGAMIASAVLFAPFGIWALATHPPLAIGWFVLAVSVSLEVVYISALGQAYRAGDLSLVYPVARGVSPLLAAFLGVAVLGERLSFQAIAGILVIVSGIFVTHLGALRLRSLLSPATGYAVLAGVCTGIYSTVDKVGVSLVWPPLYGYLIYFGMATGSTVFLLARGLRPAAVLQERSAPVIAAGALGPLAYIAVLVALSFTQVSYVAPGREVAVAIGVVLGALVLHEPFPLPRLAGALLIVGGLYLLASAT